MDHLQTYRFVLHLTKRVEELEAALAKGGITNTAAAPVVDLTEVTDRLAALEARPVVDLSEVTERLVAVEARPVVDLSEVTERLVAVEARPVVDLSDVTNRLGAVEARPELSQRLSALELAVTSLNTAN